ncbi:MAG TPA: 4-alpha-glucanotransferase [Candidatus Eisenbacteria bacterium]|nr:4-alpha-glucanotransferase [Candidatus Eisenbacteria bacterium]
MLTPTSVPIAQTELEGHRRWINSANTSVVILSKSTPADPRACMIPLQDLLNLGKEARMNVPGRPDGNWRCRATERCWRTLILSGFAI